MEQKNIKILGGQEMPVECNALAFTIFEQIAEKSIFKESFESLRSRAVIIISCVLAANDNSTITLVELLKQSSWQELNDAFGVVYGLYLDFFKIPAVAQQPEPDNKELDDEKN